MAQTKGDRGVLSTTPLRDVTRGVLHRALVHRGSRCESLLKGPHYRSDPSSRRVVGGGESSGKDTRRRHDDAKQDDEEEHGAVCRQTGREAHTSIFGSATHFFLFAGFFLFGGVPASRRVGQRTGVRTTSSSEAGFQRKAQFLT